MRLATSTCIFPKRRDGSYTTLIDSISMCHECGFDVIDLNFCNANRPGSELREPDWEHQIDLIGNHAAKLGVTFSQSHPPYDSNLWRADRKRTDEDRDFSCTPPFGPISRPTTSGGRSIPILTTTPPAKNGF